MKFTLNWLRDYLDTTASAGEIEEALTNIGLEVESLEDMGAKLKDFVVAEVKDAKPHPNADKLKLCEVFDGEATRQIVCGAPNAHTGMFAVLAKEGVVIPTNGMKIKKAKIRDVESNGMLCSARELGIGDDHEGIIELAGAPTPGSSAAVALGLEDVVFDIAITPNRGDCFGVYGIARDLAAAGLGFLKEATVPQVGEHALGDTPPTVSVNTETPLCSQFVGVTISGVKNGESPDWLKQRLEMVGQKPISVLVDVTNYIMLTFGRPLHAYDTRYLDGVVVAREAKAGESFAALNGEEYVLDEGMMVIADDKKILGLAGVMGSEGSGCQKDTSEVLIESALFDAVSIAKTGQKLNLTSDARMRFERGVDAAFVETGAKLAAQMILDVCGGVASKSQIAGQPLKKHELLTFNPKLVSQLTSLDIGEDKCKDILQSLGFLVDDSGAKWRVTPPSWRHDIGYTADLVEEVARIVGYDHITAAPLLPDDDVVTTQANTLDKRLTIGRKVLAAQGMVELRNWTFISEEQAKEVGDLNPALTLANPISSELSVMRSSLVPHLLLSAERNMNKGVEDIAIFEAGQIFAGTEYEEQHAHIAGLLAGKHTHFAYGTEQFSAAEYASTMYGAKAAAFSVLSAFGVNVEQLNLSRDVPDYYHPGRAMRISLGGKVILGYAGELHPALAGKYDMDEAVACFEIMVDNVPVPKQKTTTKKPLKLSPYPAVERDFAFTVAEDIQVEQIRRAAATVDKKLVKSAAIFDVYQGKHMEAGQKSVALRVTLESHEATLTDEQIQQVSDAIIQQVNAATGAVLRQ